MLSMRDLDVAYGRAQVIFGLSLEIGPGEIVALMGRNGAGKSTTLKAIMGLAHVTGGSITADGHNITGWAPNRVARLGIGYVPEDRRIFTDLTVAENLEVGRRAAVQETSGGVDAWTPERLFALFPNLAGLMHRRGGQISGGEQQMLSLARTLMSNPRLLLLDEPSEGLAPVIVDQLARSLATLRSQGIAVLLSEQNLRFAAGVAQRAAVIERGRIVHECAMTELLSDPAIRRAHLAVG